jgi:hypothetical protein
VTIPDTFSGLPGIHLHQWLRNGGILMKRWLAAAAALLIVLSGCAGHPESSSGSESLPEESASSSGPEAIPELPVEDSFG